MDYMEVTLVLAITVVTMGLGSPGNGESIILIYTLCRVLWLYMFPFV